MRDILRTYWLKDWIILTFLVMLSAIISFPLYGMEDLSAFPGQVESQDTSTVAVPSLQPDEAGSAFFREKLDSMANSWYIRNIFTKDENDLNLSYQRNIPLPDSLIISRLQNTESVIRLSYNPIVRDFIETIINRRPVITEIVLGLSAYYFPLFEEIFDRLELPLELKYLAIIESALNPRAVSRVGAVGLWQFMYGTAKGQNLEITSLVDERRDVLKSTEAAARYLKKLYDVYKDWHLVIAAYNCGPGNVNKAIDRAGGKTDYWKIYYALPRETREFVPAYIATTYIMNHYREHQLNPRFPKLALHTDTIMVNRYLDLKLVAQIMNMEIEALRDLNPMYRRDIVPGTPEKPYPVRIPVDFITSFISKADTIYSQNKEKLTQESRVNQPVTSADNYEIGNLEGKTRVSYTVKAGDNPGFISDWFDISVAELKLWNRINRNMIRAGQKLVIYVPDEKVEYYKRINNLSFSAKQELSGRMATTLSAPVTAVKSSAPTAGAEENFEYYTVQKGDNFWTIAKQFSGVTNTDIMQLNNITDESSLRVGQKLKIRPIIP
jgi:membrane-bound lytic murein transglycosylase D